jgi:phytoene desaturase
MRAVVIGAGIGGLAAACLLAKKRVRCHRSGAYRAGWWEDVGVHGKGISLRYGSVVAHHAVRARKIISVIAACGWSDHLELMPLHPICRYVYPDGTVFDCSHDVQQTVASIRTFAGADADAYEGFLRYSESLYKRTADAFLFNKLSEWSDLKHLNLLDLMRIDAFTNVSDRVDRWFTHPHMRKFFKRFTTYNGSSPYLAPATLNVIPYVELVQGGFYVKGGLYRVAETMRDMAIRLGVQFEFNRSVSRIDVENGTAVGVDGERFDIVVSNSDSTDTYTRLLPDSVVAPAKKRSFSAIEPSCSGFVLMLGLDKRYPQLAHHNIFFSDDYKREFDDIFVRKSLPQDPTIYIADTSHSDPSHAPEGGSNLFVMVNAPYTAGQDWAALKDTYTEHLLRQLRLRLDGAITQHIVVKEVITPADFEERYRSNRGSIYGTSSNSRLCRVSAPTERITIGQRSLSCRGKHSSRRRNTALCILSANHVISSL